MMVSGRGTCVSGKRTYWMNGSMKLTDQERFEMIEDARNISRIIVFQAPRTTSQKDNLDDYIDFLSQNMEWGIVVPTKRITTNYKL